MRRACALGERGFHNIIVDLWLYGKDQRKFFYIRGGLSIAERQGIMSKVRFE
jgi:hypothetical protein